MADFYTDQNGVRVPANVRYGVSLNTVSLIYSKSLNGTEPVAPEDDIDGDSTLVAELASIGL